MANPSQLTHISFAAQLNESFEDEILDPTSGFAVLENVRQDRRGGVSKRPGYDVYGDNSRVDGSTRTSGFRGFSNAQRYTNYDPCVIDVDGTVDTFSAQAGKWVSAPGKLPEATYELRPIPTPTPSGTVYDTAYQNGCLAIASGSEDSGEPILTVVDPITGSVLHGPHTFTGDSGRVFVAEVGSAYILAVYPNGSGGYYLFSFDTTAPADGWTSVATFGTNGSTTKYSICSLGDRVGFAFAATTGTNRVQVFTLSESGVVDATSYNNSSAGVSCIDCDGRSGDTLWVAWVESNNVRAIAYDTDLAVTGTPSTVATMLSGAERVGVCTSRVTSQVAKLYAVDNDFTTGCLVQLANLSISAGAVTNGGSYYTIGNFYPASRPHCHPTSGRYYMMVAASPVQASRKGNAQGLCTLVDWSSFTEPLRPVVNIEPGLVPTVAPHSKLTYLSNATLGSGIANGLYGQYLYGFQLVKSGTGTANDLDTGLAISGSALAAINFNDGRRWQSVEHHGVNCISGGVVCTFDGARVAELGFIARPTPPGVSASGSGSLSGNFRYVAIYESLVGSDWVVSGISDPSDETGALTNVDMVTVTTNAPVVTLRESGTTRVAFYRSTETAEPPYTRVGAVDCTPFGGLVAFDDQTTPDQAASQPQLYAPSLPGVNGGALDRRAPPQLFHLRVCNGMLIGAKGSSIYYSGQPVYGEATWFSPLFEVPVGSGLVTALEVLDGTAYIFTDREVWSVPGEIPSDNGLSGGFGTPRKLASDVGCVNAKSVVVTELGVFFESMRGIELLGRGGGVTWVGENVQRTLSEYPYITAATLDARNCLVRFALAKTLDSDGRVTPYSYDPPDGEDPIAHEAGGGRDLVYDLVLQIWQSRDDKSGLERAHEPSQDAFVSLANGAQRYSWIDTDGYVYVESDGYLDAATEWVSMAAETGWFKLAGIQGRQQVNRLLFLSRLRTDTNLSLSLGYNYGDYAAARTWTATELNALLTGGWPITQLRHDPNDEADGQAVRVRIEESVPDEVGSGQGATWLALTLDITPKQGPAEVPEEAA